MQLRVAYSVSFFREMLKKKFNFEDYHDRHKPVLFFGLYYEKDWGEVRSHKGIKILWFAGTDSLMTLDLFKKGIVKKEDFDNATVVAESSWIAEDLDEMGIKYERISLFIDDIYKWGPVPLGNKLFWYRATSSRYGKKYLAEVIKEFGDLDIITNDAHSIPREKMPEIYAQCFAGVRTVEHDGESMSAGELGLMGRMSIYNGDGSFCVPFNDVKSLIETIKRLRCGYNPKIVARRARGYFLTNEAKWADLVLGLCGVGELDVANIFYEDKKRSGSIFRIVRKGDIEKIGGFGQDQFERKWFCSKMQELGKKQLICSKNSGFVAKEFKNDGNKGYGDFNEYLTKKR